MYAARSDAFEFFENDLNVECLVLALIAYKIKGLNTNILKEQNS